MIAVDSHPARCHKTPGNYETTDDTGSFRGDPQGRKSLPAEVRCSYGRSGLSIEKGTFQMNKSTATSLCAVIFAFSIATGSAGSAQDMPFIRGDVNQDSRVDIGDALGVLFFISGQGELPCHAAADFDDSGAIDVTDVVLNVEFLFRNGAPPPAPFSRCAVDPTEDELTCLEASCGADGAVRITEFMATSSSGLTDEDGDTRDWLEVTLSPTSAFQVDLGGWYLTDTPALTTAWQFPDGVILRPGESLVVFASGKDRAIAGAELHTSFQLNADGDHLFLVAPDGITIVDGFSPFPQQLLDVSYGPVRTTTILVGAGAPTLYHVPTEDDAAVGEAWTQPDYSTDGWTNGANALGFSGANTSGFHVSLIESTVELSDLATAIDVLNNPELQERVFEDTTLVIDYFTSGDSGYYPLDNPFPGIGDAEVEDFVVHATGEIVIPTTGVWSFGVHSDDGFRLEIKNGDEVLFDIEHTTPRAADDNVSWHNFTAPGTYQVELVYFQRNGDAELELFGAQGVSFGGFNPDTFRLIGDASDGGIGFRDYSTDIETDVSAEMIGINTSLWQRIPFNVENAENVGELTLRMKYDDGYVAYLNGSEIIRRNSPGFLPWNAAARSPRPLSDALVQEFVDLTPFLDLLNEGENVLAIHGLNDSLLDDGFLSAPELIAKGREPALHYMTTPTPGEENVPGAVGFLENVEFSVERGLYTNGFQLVLSSALPDVEIRYTEDGSEPTETTGLLFGGAIAISGTSVIRAAAFRDDYIPSEVTTHTYLFIEDVVRQSPNGQPPGPGWPSGSVNGQSLDYGMDPDIVNSPTYSASLRDALRAIPSISLATDIDNLMSSSTGIYVNAQNDGRAWERPTSIELLQPDGSPGFGVNAGLRIRGAFSRNDRNPKHSFRVIFRNVYGAGKLRFPLFGGEGVDEFDKIDLRTSQNYSWASSGSEQNTFIREVFSRDSQRDMSQPYTRSRYYHLYINTHYWGLFQTQERADADFAESYLGGNEDDYDVVKNDSSGSRALQATAGTIAAYRRLYDAAVAGFSSDSAYRQVQGLLPDGAPDPEGDVLVDVDNLMDYMASTYYTGDPDAPVSAWAHFSNNIFAIYNHAEPAGFSWFRHDAEHSLGANGGLNEGRLLTDSTDRSIGQEWRHFNPAWLHLRLTQNDEYLIRFADRVNKHFFHGGVFSPAKNSARWSERAQQIDLAVIAASARWGDARSGTPRTRDDWLAQSNWMLNTYFPQRTQIVLQQMRSVSMFPAAAIVSFNQQGGAVEPGFGVTMAQSNGSDGQIWYTVNGPDPREWGGGLSPEAQSYPEVGVTIDETATVRARVRVGATWGALTKARFSVGLEGLVINEIMASNATTLEDPIEPGEFPDWIELYNGTAATIDLGGMFVTDDPLNLTHWQLQEGLSIGAGEYLLIFADDDGSTHPLHTNFQLSANGETVALVDTDGETIIDSILFEEQTPDVSYGRAPDGGSWGFSQTPTPGEANSGHAP